MPMLYAIEKGLEMLECHDKIHDILMRTDNVSKKVFDITYVVYESRRKWVRKAFMDGVGVGVAVSVLVAIGYSFFQ